MALDKSTQRKIDGVVREWTDQGRMFTAFEISLEVKQQGMRERHRNMRSTVHQSIARIAGENYSRTLRDVGAPVQAWVYHRLRDNPYDYQPLDRGDNAQNRLGPKERSPAAPKEVRNPRPLQADDGQPASVDDGAFGTDDDGKLVISADMVVRLGLAAGEKADLQCDTSNEEIRVLRPSSLQRTQPDAVAEVDADGKLRISQENLDKAGLGALQAYHVVSRGNMVTIRPFSQ